MNIKIIKFISLCYITSLVKPINFIRIFGIMKPKTIKFTPFLMQTLDCQNIENLAGVDWGTIGLIVSGNEVSPEDRKAVFTVLKMIKNEL